MIPAPVDLAARLHSIDDVIERARAAQQAIADATALRCEATRVRHEAMLEAYERHGFTSISLGRELGISGARALVLVTEARVIRDRERENRGPWFCATCHGQIAGGPVTGWKHLGPAEQGHGATADADHQASPA